MGDHHFTLQVLAEEAPIEAGEPETARLKFLNDAIARRAPACRHRHDGGPRGSRARRRPPGRSSPETSATGRAKPRSLRATSRPCRPFTIIPSGRATGNHWGEALAPFVTSARSPFHFSLHASDPSDPDGGSRKDTGHTFVCGPTGSGKTVLVGFLVSMLARQNVTQVVFDKDHGLEILVRALGGSICRCGTVKPTGFNPLQLPQTPANFEFLKTWLRALMRAPAALSAREEADLDHALRGTLALEISHRRLSRLIEFTDATRAEGIHARLSRWCECTRGDYAWVFDNARDSLAERLEGQSVIGFDVTDFLDNEAVRAPITLYLFHLVRQLIDGRRFVCWADEFSRLLADPAFEEFAKDGLKVWRKLNGVFCAATQSPSDALASPISRTIIEQTATKIFFPNPDAQAEDYIGGFALTEREFKLLKEQIEPGTRMFLVKQGHRSIVCQLDLKGFDAELAVISGRASTVERMRRLIEQLGPDPAAWLPAFMQAGRKPMKSTRSGVAIIAVVALLAVAPCRPGAICSDRCSGRHPAHSAGADRGPGASDRAERALPGPSVIPVHDRHSGHAKPPLRHESQLPAD